MNMLWKKFNDKVWKIHWQKGKQNARTENRRCESEGRGNTGSVEGSCGRATTVTTPTHYTTADEFYLGVVSEKPVTIYLPAAAPDGKIIVVKAEMKPPLGNRKVHIATTDGSTIDGYVDADITVSHGKMIFIRNNGNWFVIG